MDAATVRADLVMLCAADADPTLDPEELDRLVARARMADAEGNAPDGYGPWQPQRAYNPGDHVVPTVRNDSVYGCAAGGTSGLVEPAWPAQPPVSTALPIPAGVAVTQLGSPGTAIYGYRVSAVDTGGQPTAPSREVLTGTGPTTLSAGDANVISWEPVPNAAGYHVYGRSQGNQQRLTPTPITATSYTDTGAATPSGALPGAITDGNVVWLHDGPALWTPTYDVNAAAALGWRLKAAKASSRIDFSADGASFTHSKLAASCLQMATLYASRASIGELITPPPYWQLRMRSTLPWADMYDPEEILPRTAYQASQGYVPGQLP